MYKIEEDAKKTKNKNKQYTTNMKRPANTLFYCQRQPMLFCSFVLCRGIWEQESG